MIGFYFLPVAFACGLGIGLLAGMWAHAHLYQHFLKNEEEKANRKVIRALNEQNKKQIDAQLVVKKLREAYGNDLSAGHVAVVEEEIERVLGTGPNGRANAR